MLESIINKETEENIKNYLAEKDRAPGSSDDSRFFFEQKNKNKFKSRKALLSVVFLILIIVGGMAYFSRQRGENSFDEKKVVINVDSPREVSSGEEIGLEIKYENGTEVALNDPTINLIIPDSFVFRSSDPDSKREKTVLSWSVGKLMPGKSGKIKLYGKIIGRKDSDHVFGYKISYKPSNINSEYKAEGNLKIKVISIPFELSVKSASAINSGDEVEYVIDYKNISSRTFASMKITALTPAGFEYKSSEPGVTETREGSLAWNISNVNSEAEGELKIKGSLKGNKDEEKTTQLSLEASEDANMFSYIESDSVTKINEIPIVLSQTINGESGYSVDKNGELEYRIKFKNISGSEIKGLIINSELEGNVDFSTIDIVDGSFDGKNKVTWSALNIPKLALLGPGEEDEVSFKIKVNNIIDIKDPKDKNFIILNKVSVKSFNFNSGSSEIGKTIASNESEVKIRSFLVIKTSGYFNDDGRIKNIGSIPPEVGKETSYTIHWNLRNLFNDTENIKVASALPPGVEWTGNYIMSSGKVSSGDETNGVFTPEIIDPNTISSISGGMGEGGLGVGYSWYDEIVYKDINHKGLPQGLQIGDTLKFVYFDGTIEQTGYCDIGTDPGANKDHSFFCAVPWKVSLPFYAKKENYKIEKAVPIVSEEKFYYNSQTREVVWEIPGFAANMGILSPAEEVVFQVGITPKTEDVGKVIKIMDKANVSGYDKFTNSDISSLGSEITTDLPDDDSVGPEEGAVIPASEGSETEMQPG